MKKQRGLMLLSSKPRIFYQADFIIPSKTITTNKISRMLFHIIRMSITCLS